MFYNHVLQRINTCLLFFANEGYSQSGTQILNQSQVKRMNALMQTCGFYDESGEFTFRVGLPGKSGVGGGIVALLPKQFIVSTWSPRLNANGNSELGMYALEQLTTKTGMSIFSINDKVYLTGLKNHVRYII